ncbi:uncharacterized protein LOC109950223 [Prunus persica]|uniref:uncharacterized protein LOC109950223 n=1 Tax=Prunus persica TaxID=3760 RepID=UPI0009AB7C7E|nr:uncharacterized protein LOC109950223 [Prunus persica]
MEGYNSVQNPIVPETKLIKDEGGEKVDSTYFKQIVGSLMYLTTTRPDPMFAVNLISRYMESPTELHFQAAKRVLRYLKGTTDLGLFYKRKVGAKLMGFSDNDYVGDLNDRKSTSGYVFLLSSAVVAWSSRKQPIVTLSTTEAEFIVAASDFDLFSLGGNVEDAVLTEASIDGSKSQTIATSLLRNCWIQASMELGIDVLHDETS